MQTLDNENPEDDNNDSAPQRNIRPGTAKSALRSGLDVGGATITEGDLIGYKTLLPIIKYLIHSYTNSDESNPSYPLVGPPEALALIAMQFGFGHYLCHKAFKGDTKQNTSPFMLGMIDMFTIIMKEDIPYGWKRNVLGAFFKAYVEETNKTFNCTPVMLEHLNKCYQSFVEQQGK